MNYKYQYDKYNDKFRWVSVAGDVAGLRAETNTDLNTWWASAGLDRGQIKNAQKIAFNPNLGQRDMLYKNKVNPIVSFPGQGNAIVWGQKTLQSKPSASKNWFINKIKLGEVLFYEVEAGNNTEYRKISEERNIA
jgi:phage tail sheath protein FI